MNAKATETMEIRIKTGTVTHGFVTVDVIRKPPFDKVWSAVVVDRDVYNHEDDVPAIGYHFYMVAGVNVGEHSNNPRWADIPPNPVCPVCGQGRHIGYSYDGLNCSCWQRKDDEVVICWKGEPHELVEDPSGIGNPWIRQIACQGCN